MKHVADSQARLRQFEDRSGCYARRGYDRREAARFVASVLDPARADAVLDIGTGKGMLAVELAARGPRVVSIDTDPTNVPLARDLADAAGVTDRLTFVTGDAARLPFPDRHFGSAASMDVLHHLSDPEPVLRDVVRTLSPHGEILLADFSPEGFELVGEVLRDDGREHPVSGVTVDDAAACLQQWGFRAVLRLTRHMHDIAVFARHDHALGEDTLQRTRRTAHPHCHVCGSDNPSGLRLAFEVQPDRSVHAVFHGGPAYQGYPDAIHGGMVATLLDAAMTNCLFSRGISAVTARMNIRYVTPARWYVPCDVSARLERTVRGLRYLVAEVSQKGQLVARASGTFMDRHMNLTASTQPAPIRQRGDGA